MSPGLSLQWIPLGPERHWRPQHLARDHEVPERGRRGIGCDRPVPRAPLRTPGGRRSGDSVAPRPAPERRHGRDRLVARCALANRRGRSGLWTGTLTRRRRHRGSGLGNGAGFAGAPDRGWSGSRRGAAFTRVPDRGGSRTRLLDPRSRLGHRLAAILGHRDRALNRFAHQPGRGLRRIVAELAQAKVAEDLRQRIARPRRFLWLLLLRFGQTGLLQELADRLHDRDDQEDDGEEA